MPIRITGINSGLDTESIISELVKAKSKKKDDLVKAQTKLQWKQDAWKELNSKVYSLYSKTLSNMRLKSDYSKKTTKVSNSSAVSVITGSKAVNGVQTLSVDKVATTGYLTGAQIGEKNQYKATDKLTSISDFVKAGSEITLTVGGKEQKITIDQDMTIDGFVTKLKEAGLNASFDEKNQRFFISSKTSGKSSDFEIGGDDKVLRSLGLATKAADTTEYEKYCEKDDNGKYVAKQDLSSLINPDIADRLKKYKENRDNAATAKTQLDALVDGYKNKYQGETDFDVEKLNLEELQKDSEQKEAQLEEKRKLLEEKQKQLEEAKVQNPTQDNSALENEITALMTNIGNLKTEFYHLHDKISVANQAKVLKDAEAAVEADKDNFEETAPDSGTYVATEKLTKEITAEHEAKAATAAKLMNTSIANKIDGEDAQITLNGAVFTSDSNTFEINGLTITAISEAKGITITTADDTDGIYDMVKNFLKEYNELINEMDSLYNADSAKGYEPLTDEEKEAMSEKEVEKWEEKIKKSILRKDSTLSSVASAMKQVMAQGVDLKDEDGNVLERVFLSEFGVGTLGYFTAKENEKNAYHIDGDPDDESTSTNADKLKTAIANDPDRVIEVFSTLSMNLYNKLGDLMKKTEYSSSFTLYDDVAMKNEYNDYTSKIQKQEQKITDFEDRYYKKFSAMETALTKLSSKESAISGLLGM